MTYSLVYYLPTYPDQPWGQTTKFKEFGLTKYGMHNMCDKIRKEHPGVQVHVYKEKEWRVDSSSSDDEGPWDWPLKD